MVDNPADRSARGACKYDHELRYRVLPGRHREVCDGGMGDCQGCLPCPERHCIVCGREHVDRQTCAGCIGRVRDDLKLLEVTFALRVAALSRPNADIPGGLAQVLLGPYSPGIAALHLALTHGDWHELDDDGIGPEPLLLTLATWEDDWRREFHHDAGPRATITRAVAYLDRNLDRAAQEHLAFDEFATDVRAARRRLEVAADDADPTVFGVACFDCGADLRQTFNEPRPCPHPNAPCGCDQGGRRDSWECTRCGRSYTEHDYRRAVRQAHTDVQPWRRASEITAITGVPGGTLRRWAHHGYLTVKPSGTRSWVLYHLGEVRRHAMDGGLLPQATDSATVANASGG